MKNTDTQQAIARQSRQLRMSPERLTEKALAMAVRVIDNAIAHNVPPFEGCLVDDWDGTRRLNRLTPNQLANLANVHPVPQIALRTRDDQRKGFAVVSVH